MAFNDYFNLNPPRRTDCRKNNFFLECDILSRDNLSHGGFIIKTQYKFTPPDLDITFLTSC